jgi:hypothetical protein
MCGAGLLASSRALTFCRPAVSASICFSSRAIIAPCSHCAVLFQKLVEQHRVHLIVAHTQGFAVLSRDTKSGFIFSTSSAIRRWKNSMLHFESWVSKECSMLVNRIKLAWPRMFAPSVHVCGESCYLLSAARLGRLQTATNRSSLFALL